RVQNRGQGIDGQYLVLKENGGYIFGSSTGRIYSMDEAGNTIWSTQLNGAAHSEPLTLGMDGTVYVPTEAGKVYAIHATNPPAKEIWPMFQHDSRRTGRLPPGPQLPAPPAPKGLTASQGTYALVVRLAWQGVPYASSYEVWRAGENDVSK